MTSRKLRGEQLSLIKPPRKGGNTAPKRGRWGVGIQTETTRVPVGLSAVLPDCLMGIMLVIQDYSERSTSTRNWTEANRLMDDLAPYLEPLFKLPVELTADQTRDRG